MKTNKNKYIPLDKFINNLYKKTIVKTVNDNELEIDNLYINLDK